MSATEIEAELEQLSLEELRRIALRSWSVYLQREAAAPGSPCCDEDNAELLAALDDAILRADKSGSEGQSADSIRARLRAWTTK